ncbi:hypothetical protein MMC07_003235 [Pseudocyphellaria aurata]|nr:hypothetical protein [Pseudocyphellaria aurata]
MKLSLVLAGIAALTVSATTVVRPTLTSASACTTTIRTFGALDLSPTTTVYAKTKTALSKVNCGGCSLRVQNIAGLGPVRPEPTATVYKRKTTTTKIVCVHTPKPYGPAYAPISYA